MIKERTIKADISPGELMDKLTILEIKMENIQEEEKSKNVKKEYDLLNTIIVIK